MSNVINQSHSLFFFTLTRDRQSTHLKPTLQGDLAVLLTQKALCREPYHGYVPLFSGHPAILSLVKNHEDSSISIAMSASPPILRASSNYILPRGISQDNKINIIIGVLTIMIGILSSILAWSTWKLTRDRRRRLGNMSRYITFLKFALIESSYRPSCRAYALRRASSSPTKTRL